MARADRRGARSGRKSRSKQKQAKPAVDEPRVYQHPLYGPIPLLVYTWTDGDGESRATYTFDPDYQPPLPPGAVRGDPRRQSGRGAFDTPCYYYVDRPRCCVQCRESFVFRAAEQKHWYETLGFNFASVAIRCGGCRRKRRSEKALHHAVADAKRTLADAPEDPGALLAMAEAIVTLRERMNRGKLDEAVAAARKARRLMNRRSESERPAGPPASRAGREAAEFGLKSSPASAQALTHYWEGRAQALRERVDDARACFEAFLEHAAAKAHRAHIRVATRWLEAHPRSIG